MAVFAAVGAGALLPALEMSSRNEMRSSASMAQNTEPIENLLKRVSPSRVVKWQFTIQSSTDALLQKCGEAGIKFQGIGIWTDLAHTDACGALTDALLTLT